MPSFPGCQLAASEPELVRVVYADLCGRMEGGVGLMLSYCVNCRDRYLAHGRDARHLLELCYPETQGLRKKAPTWSERQKNRADLKRSLLSELCGEKIEQEPEMKLYIEPEVERKLEESCILHSDIARVIEHAEETGEKFVAPESGRATASFRPENVTFWVEYSPEGEGQRVYNAYSHRMTFILTDRISSGEEAGNG